MTLGQLRREMTYEELLMWITYFGLIRDQQQEAMKKSNKTASIELIYRRFFLGDYGPHRHPGRPSKGCLSSRN